MLSQKVVSLEGTSALGLTPASVAVTRWKDWPCSGPDCLYASVPAPVDQFVWRGTNYSDFDQWDAATQTPGSDWKLVSKVVTRDSKVGIELEQAGPGDQYSAVVLDDRKRPIATLKNGRLMDAAFTSFEDSNQGLWSWSDGSILTGASRSGTRHFSLGTNGLTKTGLTASEKYLVSFWVKSSGGSAVVDGVGTVNLGTLSIWTFFQYQVTGLSSLAVRRTGTTEVLLDDVRVHKVGSLMSTTTYHPLFGLDSETDANNRTMFTEFDEFGRPKLIRDQDRFIVKHFFSNTK